MAKYVAPARAAGLVPGGPPVSERAMAGKGAGPGSRTWLDTRLGRPSWPEIDPHHGGRIEALVGVVPASVAHQRLVDEVGLGVSVASFRRYAAGPVPRRGAPGRGGHLAPAGRAPATKPKWTTATWAPGRDPASGQRRRVWAFSMVLSYSRHLFVCPVSVMDQQAWADAHVAAFEFFGSSPAPGCARQPARRGGQARPLRPQDKPGLRRTCHHYNVLVDPAQGVANPKTSHGSKPSKAI